jgi:hypothetical protein
MTQSTTLSVGLDVHKMRLPWLTWRQSTALR